MTEQEIANRLFGTSASGSATSQSLLSGVAVEASSGGQVKVQIDGAQIGIGDQDSVLLDTTCSVAAGQRVTITLFGRDGQGKKAFVSGVVGGGGGGGGGDIDELEQRMDAAELAISGLQSSTNALATRMSTAESDITALQTRLGTDESKINEVIGVINDFKWQRLYLWTLAGYSRASLWYRKATGEVMVAVNINGQMSSGWNWYNTGTALPTDLRPTAFPTAALISARNTIWANPLILICSGDDGRVSAYMQNSGTSSEGGTISYLVQPGLNYSSTTWTGPDISQLSLTRALAARIALGDGLAEQQDLEKDEAAYNEAFDIIFGDEK